MVSRPKEGLRWWWTPRIYFSLSKKVKVAHTRLPSVGFWSWSRFLAVSLQVTWIINTTVGCHYFPPGLRYLRNPQEGCYQFCCLVNRGTMGVNSLPKTVTRQRRDCDLNPGPSASESSTRITRLPSHPIIWLSIEIETGLIAHRPNRKACNHTQCNVPCTLEGLYRLKKGKFSSHSCTSGVESQGEQKCYVLYHCAKISMF